MNRMVFRHFLHEGQVTDLEYCYKGAGEAYLQLDLVDEHAEVYFEVFHEDIYNSVKTINAIINKPIIFY